MTRFHFLFAALFLCSAAHAPPQDLLQSYAVQAKQENPQFQAFSAARGEQLYHAKRTHSSGKMLSCASCHTDNPKSAGRHEKTGKAIQPLAPIANRDRFADTAKVEKWFKRNCQDVLERACSVQEKGDFVTYLLSLK